MAIKEIRVNDFYRNACPTKAAFSELVHEENKATSYRWVVRTICKDLVRGEYSDERLLETLTHEYKDSYFAFPWQKKQAIADDAEKIKRFVRFISDTQLVDAERKVTVGTGEHLLTATVDLIFKTASDRYGAIVIKTGKANKSPGGKSVHTSTKTDLNLMVAKESLETDYPGIAVSLVFLSNDADTYGNIGPFVQSKYRSSNIFTEDFGAFYEDGRWQSEAFLSKMEDVLSVPVQPDCFGCFEKDLCTADTIFTMDKTKAKRVEKKQIYKMPDFTDAQKKVTSHVDGPLLCCAGPGSGKTATIIGRGNALIRAGIEPEFILAITFTNKAAGELKDRFTACCGDDIPKCSTIHALALEILQRNKELVGEVRVLSQYEKVLLCEELSDTLGKPIEGFKYGSGREGKNAFLQTLSRRVDEYFENPDAFKRKHKDIGQDFYALAADYDAIRKARGFLGFDDIIKRCNTLFAEHPEVLKAYSAIYKYIMVDEYQDIDAEQAKFIYALASHGNLVAVGDDDQTIYEFRGGTNKYMLEFREHFPNAKVVVLDRNFRSTGALVKASQELIVTNKQRIEKKVGSARQSGIEPFVISGQTPADIAEVVADAVKAGYSYSDIAVTAWKNPTLENLSKSASFPNVLGKAMLTDSALFHIALDILAMAFHGMDDRHMAHYLTVMGMEELSDIIPCGNGLVSGLYAAGYFDEAGQLVTQKADEGPAEALIFDALSLYIKLSGYIRNGCAAFFFLDTLLSHFDMEDTSIAEALEGVIEARRIKSVDRLYEVLQYMADFGDDTRLEPERGDSVLFITSHESKGMEFPVVIMVDDYSDDKKEGTTRLYYVAMTRAKDRLYICKKPQATTLYDLVAKAS